MGFLHCRIAALVALLPALSGPAAASEIETRTLESGHCLAALRDDAGLGGGIPTGRLATRVRFVTCADRERLVALDAGLLVLRSWTVAPEEPADPPDPTRLPDGEITGGDRQVAEAWLTAPTDIYGHAILGDAVEASGFRLRLTDGRELDYRLGERSVFEDLRLRLVDLTGDGDVEMVAIRSYLDAGAALAVYGLEAGAIVPLAETAPIGIPNRWLNPAGAADFDGDGRVEIALVETPHIGGTLRLFELRDGALVEEVTRQGFSNHAIGSRVLDLSAVLDWNGDGLADLALPDAGRRTIEVLSFAGGAVERLAQLPMGAPLDTPILATDLNADGRPELLYGEHDGRLVLVLAPR